MDDFYQCDYCMASFSKVVDIEKHIYNHLMGVDDDSKLKSAKKYTALQIKLNNKKHDAEGEGDSYEEDSNEDVSDNDNNNGEGEVIDRNDENLGKCCICLHPFSNCFEYTSHAEKESVTMVIQCTVCLFYFENVDALENHRNQKRCNKLSGISCNDLIMKSDKRNKTHFSRRMGSLKCMLCANIICQCGQAGNNKKVDIEKYPFECLLCKIRVPTMDSYRRHINTLTHTDRVDSQPHECSTCNVKFNSERGLLIHYEIHMNRTSYKCSFCPREFTRPDLNLKHMKTCEHSYSQKPESLEKKLLDECEEGSSISAPECDEDSSIRAPECDEDSSIRAPECDEDSSIRAPECDEDSSIRAPECDNTPEQPVNIMKQIPSETNHANIQFAVDNAQPCSQFQRREKGSLKCSRCEKVFPNLTEWLFHDETHPEDKPFRCILCNSKTNSYKSYKKHVLNESLHKDADNGSQQHKCPTCDDKFKTARDLLKHYSKHMELRPYQCSFCEFTCPRPDQLMRHKKDIHGGVVKYRLKCEICKTSLPRERQYHILHSTEHHKGSCFVCKKRIPELFDLKHHVAGHFGFTQCGTCNTSFHNTDMLRGHMPCTSSLFVCENCGDKFPDTEALKGHMKSHEEKEGSPLEKRARIELLCEICGFVCFTSQVYRHHANTHNTEQPNEFKCNICNSYHNNLRSLKIHQNFNHSIEKLFPCPICDKSCISKSALRKHKKRHAKVAALEAIFKCDKCEEKFTSKSLLKRHRNVHMYATKPYKCDQCEVAFAQRCNLTKHKLVHSDDKPYACDKCDAAFKHQSNLTKHKHIHTGDFPLRCKVCSYGFTTRNSLIDHLKTHDGLKLYK